MACIRNKVRWPSQVYGAALLMLRSPLKAAPGFKSLPHRTRRGDLGWRELLPSDTVESCIATWLDSQDPCELSIFLVSLLNASYLPVKFQECTEQSSYMITVICTALFGVFCVLNTTNNLDGLSTYPGYRELR